MTDREKVIKALELCTSKIETRIQIPCETCPYHNRKYHGVLGNGCCNARSLQRDALALLKAQEPRVLALEEIHRGMAVWLEDVDKADMILAIGGASAGGAKCFITEKDMSIAPKDAEYGIRWRAWTQKPTDEQREKVKWYGTD